MMKQLKPMTAAQLSKALAKHGDKPIKVAFQVMENNTLKDVRFANILQVDAYEWGAKDEKKQIVQLHVDKVLSADGSGDEPEFVPGEDSGDNH